MTVLSTSIHSISHIGSEAAGVSITLLPSKSKHALLFRDAPLMRAMLFMLIERHAMSLQVCKEAFTFDALNPRGIHRSRVGVSKSSTELIHDHACSLKSRTGSQSQALRSDI
jgi:hypothetical protein